MGGGLCRVLVLAVACLQAWVPPARSLPRNPEPLTVFHVNPVSYGVLPANQNTADFDGFLAFSLMSVWQPLACLIDPTDPNCDNPEIFVPPDKLAVTQLLLEVDPRFGQYGKCNICRQGHDPMDPNRTCVDGEYTCNCDPWQAFPLSAAIMRHTGGWPRFTTECSSLVGRHHLRHEDMDPCNASMAAVDCWWINMVAKVGGSWYTTPAWGFCNATTVGPCTWWLREVVHRVSKACADDIVFGAVEQARPWCFRSCGRRNTTSPCWIRCFMAATLGPEAAYSDAIGGLPLPVLRDIWWRPFRPVSAGGCPRLPAQADGVRAPTVGGAALPGQERPVSASDR
eukprot:EG_transcript_18508